MRLLIPTLIASVSIGATLVSPSAMAITRYVNCDEGQTIVEAIEKATSRADRLEILVSGTCQEAVLVRRSDVTIDGGDTAVIEGRISALAGGLWIYNLTVTGAAGGVIVADGNARLWNVRLVENEGDGLTIRRNSYADLRDSMVSGNGGHGIVVQSGVLDIRYTDVYANGAVGIVVDRNAMVSMEGGSVTGHENGTGISVSMSSGLSVNNASIDGNGDGGVFVAGASNAVLSDCHVNGNAHQGILVADNSALDFAGGMIAWNGENGVYALRHAFVALIDTQVTDNAGNGVYAETDAGVTIVGPTFIERNDAGIDIACSGKEASLEIGLEPPGSIGTIDCVDPDF